MISARESHYFTFVPREISSEGVKTTAGENVSTAAIVTAIAALVYRYTGCENVKLNVKTAYSEAAIEIDVARKAITAGQLFRQSHLKLKDISGLSAGTSDITIELPGAVMRPVMRSINESADSEATILLQRENAQTDKGRIDCKFVYSGKHYSGELIQQMARHFKNILSDMTERPNVEIKDIAMLDTQEIAAILKRGMGEVVSTRKKCAHHLFEEQAAKNPDATALICDEQKMSFADLNSRANVIGRYLQDLGVCSGTMVGVGIERSIEAVVCILAIFKTGAAYAIIDPEYPAARIEEMLSDAHISLLITKSSSKSKFDSEGLRIIDYEQFLEYTKEDAVNVVSDVTVNDAAYITFTSGSTGKPKGIIGMHLSVSTLLYYSQFFYKDGISGKVSGLLSPLGFGASVCGVFLPLCNGVPLVIIPNGEEKDPHKFACRVYEHKITSFIITTALARQLCELNDEGKKLLQPVKHAGIGGAEIKPELFCKTDASERERKNRSVGAVV